MKVTHREQISLAGHDPPLFVNLLALWAMAVAARIIADPDIATIFALVNMTSQFSSTA
jgi:hypothetical protein